jgi:hypothetical protein
MPTKIASGMNSYAIIAGKGELPLILAQALKDAKIICIDGEENPQLKPDLITKFGQVGMLIDYLKENNITHLIFAGGIKKPNLSEIKPDAEGAKLISKIIAGRLFGGDNKLLSTIIKYLEGKGFQVAGAHEVVPNLITPRAVIGSIQPFLSDIEIGLKAAHDLGKKDIGQAVIIEDGRIIATEDYNGTQDLIKRAGELKKTSKAFLVKACKPQQDKRVDLPAIGVDTVVQCSAAGIAGIALEAGSSIILNVEAVKQKADELGVFVVGI